MPDDRKYKPLAGTIQGGMGMYRDLYRTYFYRNGIITDCWKTLVDNPQ